MRFVFAAMALLLAGCGFEPMYAPSAHGRMAIGPVHVETIEGKAGHVLKTELDRMLAVEDNGSTPSQLDITLREDVVLLGLRLDESASRAELRLTANYVLTPASGGRPLRGSINSVVTYEIPTAAFGEISAQDDARERAAETLAQRMRAELAIRLHQRSSAS
ncbi:MAG TPA: LPS assembly lipoprotein LptE [Caulobacterales bacterium]|nr:LPS assembly lipoprotein LptE [Caulobacterales bacterium]